MHRSRPALRCGTRQGALVASFDETGPLINGLLSQVPDIDPAETNEWLESLDGLIDDKGGPRARYLLLSLLKRARERNVAVPRSLNTPYVNTIGVDDEPYFPGDEAMERRYRSFTRWNAAVMVTRAQRPGIGVGGHISSYASVATLYEVGLNHFFRGKDHPGGGADELGAPDLVAGLEVVEVLVARDGLDDRQGLGAVAALDHAD